MEKFLTDNLWIFIGGLTIVYVFGQLGIKLLEKIVWEFFNNKSKAGVDNSTQLIVDSMDRSHSKIEGQIVRVLDVQKNLLLQLKSMKTSGLNNLNGNMQNHEQQEKQQLETCLLVEDNEIVAPSLIEMLHILGYHVNHVANYKDAVTMIKTLKFKFALVDYNLNERKTGIDFWNFCKDHNFIMNKSNGTAGRVRAIIYSGFIEGGAPPGMCYLEKPFSMNTLQNTIERITKNGSE